MKLKLNRSSWLLAFIILELVLASGLIIFGDRDGTLALALPILTILALVKAVIMIANPDKALKDLNQLQSKLDQINETYLGGIPPGKRKGDIGEMLEQQIAAFAGYINQVDSTSTGGHSRGGLLYEQLNSLKEKVRISNEKDKHTIWASEGHAKVSDILRANSDNLDEACYKVLSYLTKFVRGQVGAIYITEEDANNIMHLELKACYAFDKKRYLEQRIDVSENLIGQCFLEKEVVLLKEVPDDYLKITSGLGEQKPRSLILVPLKFNETVHGVIELASFHQFNSYEVDFLKKLSEIIASSIVQLRNGQQTRELLALSQNQSEEMRANEEELRQNMEELESTQEQMHRQVQELTTLKQALEKERSFFDALMNYLPDTIYFKDKQSKLLRVSKHMEQDFGKGDLIGKSDFDFQDREHAQKAFDDEQQIMMTRRPLVDIIEKEIRSDGSENWVSTTKLPLINQSNEVVGTFGISRNISKLKNLEKAVNLKQEQMEAEKVAYQERIKALEQELQLVRK